MDISKEAQTAIYKMIHQSKGISPKEIAQLTGDSHNTILNYANPNMENHLPSLKKLEAIMMFTQNPEILKIWAHKLGMVLVPINTKKEEQHRELSIFEALMQQNIATGKATEKVYEAYEDGVITPAEYEDIHDITQSLIELATAVDQAALKQMKVYTATSLSKEKA